MFRWMNNQWNKHATESNELVTEDKTHANNRRNDGMRDHYNMSSHQTDRRKPVLRDGTQSNQKAEEQMESKEESGQEKESKRKRKQTEQY